MAGLECPECFTPTLILSNSEMVEDGDGEFVYKRYRVCLNERCRLYRIRLSTLEVYAPIQEAPYVIPYTKRFRDKPLRTQPVPDEPIKGVNL